MSQHQRQPRQREHYEQQGYQSGQQGHQQQPRQQQSHQQQPQQMGGGQSQMGHQHQPQHQQSHQQQPQQMGGGQTQMGRQQQPPQMGGGQQQEQFETQRHQPQTGEQFSRSMPQPVVTAVEHLDRLETTAEFADGRATQQGNIEAAQIADAMKDVAHLQKELIVEENPMAQEFGQCCQQVLQSGMQQLQGYQQQPEIQELSETCQQTIQTISRGLQSMPTGGQGQGQGFGSQQW